MCALLFLPSAWHQLPLPDSSLIYQRCLLLTASPPAPLRTRGGTLLQKTWRILTHLFRIIPAIIPTSATIHSLLQKDGLLLAEPFPKIPVCLGKQACGNERIICSANTSRQANVRACLLASFRNPLTKHKNISSCLANSFLPVPEKK